MSKQSDILARATLVASEHGLKLKLARGDSAYALAPVRIDALAQLAPHLRSPHAFYAGTPCEPLTGYRNGIDYVFWPHMGKVDERAAKHNHFVTHTVPMFEATRARKNARTIMPPKRNAIQTRLHARSAVNVF